ncbi:hypothetical protein TNCV_211161 [Trichonephila clavipes]|uniref:RNase H type-1 domain-containing protein n=1 Tax=Trichonephila clavipes TaxID=2585209 RepID=A0A8X6VSA2_TRICX|nr:hypothetical protein TNCV_211161 [Trichonephila clavipes]
MKQGLGHFPLSSFNRREVRRRSVSNKSKSTGIYDSRFQNRFDFEREEKLLCPTALRAIALETINTRYPPDEWLYIYTDGSFLDFTQGTGAGVFCDIFPFYSHALASDQGKSARVQDCRELLRKIPTKVVFQWVPSHCGLWGNETAEPLSKKRHGHSPKIY